MFCGEERELDFALFHRVDFAVFNNEKTKYLHKVGVDCEQPGLVEVVPTHGEGFEIDDFQGSFQLKPFCDSTYSRTVLTRVCETHFFLGYLYIFMFTYPVCTTKLSEFLPEIATKYESVWWKF